MTEPAQTLRAGEIATGAPLPADAALAFIGRIETPWAARADCPKQGDPEGPDCALVLAPEWAPALDGIETAEWLDVLYWLHLSRRDLLVQVPRHAPQPKGTFALRSPVRPNPIGLAKVRLMRRAGNRLVVKGLDCVTGTPLIDLKPDRCGHSRP